MWCMPLSNVPCCENNGNTEPRVTATLNRISIPYVSTDAPYGDTGDNPRKEGDNPRKEGDHPRKEGDNSRKKGAPFTVFV
jgi:hypothetical protein